MQLWLEKEQCLPANIITWKADWMLSKWSQATLQDTLWLEGSQCHRRTQQQERKQWKRLKDGSPFNDSQCWLLLDRIKGKRSRCREGALCFAPAACCSSLKNCLAKQAPVPVLCFAPLQRASQDKTATAVSVSISISTSSTILSSIASFYLPLVFGINRCNHYVLYTAR